MFMTNRCWHEWMEYFSQHGFECEAPAWPLKDLSPADLRAKHPDLDGEGKIRLADVVATYVDYCSRQNKSLVLIGHSLGGLIVQVLLSRGFGSAGIVIDSAPPKGVVTTKFSFVKSNWPILAPFSPRTVPVLLTKKQFHYAFADHLNGSALDQAYEEVVPQSRYVGLDTLTNEAKIDFSKKTAPLLFIAGGRDHIVPSSLNESNYRKYARNNSRTDFKLFPQKRHNLINDEGWRDIADYSLNWLNSL
jgi:esterase/lipase